MGWQCSNCREDVDDRFDVCWACGTSRDGAIDPEFRHADSYEAPIPDDKPQFALGSLFRLMTALCFMFAALAASESADLPRIVTIVLGFAAIGYLFLLVVGWLITRKAHRWQRKIRENQGETSRH